MTLSYFRADPFIVRILVLLAKAIVAIVTLLLCLLSRGFFPKEEDKVRLYDSIIPLFVAMTLLSPLVWEHHALFLTLPFLLLLKKLRSPADWVSYGAVYFPVFLTPIFDYFPWSYGRLVGMLILLGLLWTLRARVSNTFFSMFNAWAESVFGWKAETRTA
jgi:hypothetical protein